LEYFGYTLTFLQCRFLEEKIKVNGKAGALGDAVVLTVDGSNINVVANIPFSKRYLKYLTKKYLKKNQLRDYIQVIASSKSTYALKYFNINDGGAGEESEDEE
jgi:large subunit ribosomal protein L22e